jgi:hypothetical protein
MSLPAPYFHDERAGITIYHGDCREILPLLGRFDLQLTDPPYGRAIDTAYKDRGRGPLAGGRNHAPVIGDEEPFAPSHLMGVAAADVLWGANHFADRLPASPMWLVWDRLTASDATDAELAWVRGHRFETVRCFRHEWDGFRRASEKFRRVLHPTQKPVALMSWCLGFFPEAKTVVDPYMGSGPVAKACKDRGLRYVGIELVEQYCATAVDRLRQSVLFGTEPPL